MKKFIFVLILVLGLTLLTPHLAEARGRYGSIRVGGYNSYGKGSHYIGGYVRTCHGWVCRW